MLLADAAAPLNGKPLVEAKEWVKQSVVAGVAWEVINVRQDELLDDGWNEPRLDRRRRGAACFQC